MVIIHASVKYKPKYRYLIPLLITHREIPLEDVIHELDKPYPSIHPSIHPSTNSTLLRNWQGSCAEVYRGCCAECCAYIPSELHYPLASESVIASFSKAISPKYHSECIRERIYAFPTSRGNCI